MVYIYANIWGILMVNVAIYGMHTDPMGIESAIFDLHVPSNSRGFHPWGRTDFNNRKVVWRVRHCRAVRGSGDVRFQCHKKNKKKTYLV